MNFIHSSQKVSIELDAYQCNFYTLSGAMASLAWHALVAHDFLIPFLSFLFMASLDIIFQIEYARNVVVEFGNILDSSKVKQKPVSMKWPSNYTTLYTLIMTGSHKI